ncbi:MAG: hypothetical protein JNK49_20150 [Planctomycetes bacterium]|nr:hypothetical protein [Planctomycetota bacterium]
MSKIKPIRGGWRIALCVGLAVLGLVLLSMAATGLWGTATEARQSRLSMSAASRPDSLPRAEAPTAPPAESTEPSVEAGAHLEALTAEIRLKPGPGMTVRTGYAVIDGHAYRTEDFREFPTADAIYPQVVFEASEALGCCYEWLLGNGYGPDPLAIGEAMDRMVATVGRTRGKR